MTGPVQTPAIELRDVSKRFGSVIALNGVSMAVNPGEVHCLLGDNGAGKSTLIKLLSGVYRPSEGAILVEGRPVSFGSPRDAADAGVATVFQDLGLIPLMSIARNFFLGREPLTGIFPFRRFDLDHANGVAREALIDMGIQVRDPSQAVGTLSGGERQSVAIARAIHFGAKVIILDEPTSALGIHQAAMVLKFVIEARLRGLAVILITHNINHAYPVADVFTFLNRGTCKGTFRKSDISRDEVVRIMSGGEDMSTLEREIDALLGQVG